MSHRTRALEKAWGLRVAKRGPVERASPLEMVLRRLSALGATPDDIEIVQASYSAGDDLRDLLAAPDDELELMIASVAVEARLYSDEPAVDDLQPLNDNWLAHLIEVEKRGRMSVGDLVAWVGSDVDLAWAVHEMESQRPNQRRTLIAKMRDVIEAGR